MGLTLEEPEIVSAPGIRELPLTLECRVIYKQPQDPATITLEDRANCYPPEVSPALFTGLTGITTPPTTARSSAHISSAEPNAKNHS